MANGANESGYFQDGTFKLLLPDCALLAPGHENTPLELPAWNRHNPVLLRHGGNLNSFEVAGGAMRYTQGDGEAWLYNTLVALASCGLGDLYIGQTDRSKYENCFFISGEGDVVSGTDEGDDRCYVNYRLQFIQSAGEQPVSLSTGASPPDAPEEYSGRDSTKTYTFGGTAMGLLSEGGLRIRIDRAPLVKALPRCYGVRIKDRAQGAQGRTLEFSLDMTADPLTYPTHADFEKWFHELANNIGDEPGDLVGCGNTWADCHMTQMAHPGAAQWSHTAPNNIQLVYRQENPAVDHSTLSNLSWSVCNHTMDTDLPMEGNDITGTGQDSAAAGKYRHAYFNEAGDLIEGNADIDDLTPPSGGGASAINDLSDVTITSVTTGEVLLYTGAGWENQTLAEADIAAASDLTSHTGNTSNPHSVTAAQAGAAEDDHTHALDDLDDAAINSPMAGHLLVYDTGPIAFVNKNYADAGLAAADHNHNSTYLALAGGTMAGNIAMGGNDLTGTGQASAAAGKYRIAFLDENGDLVEGAEDRDDKSTPGGGTMDVEEYDGGTSGSADKLVFPVGSLASLGSNDYLHWPHGADDGYRPWGNLGVYGYARLNTGSYTGDGLDKKAVSGYSGRPLFAVVKGASTQLGNCRFMQAAGKGFSASVLSANRIVQLASDGFKVGTDATVNTSAAGYYHFGFGAAGLPTTGVRMAVGSYTGDGVDDKEIATTGVNPDLVWIKRDGAHYTVWKSDQHTGEATSYFSALADIASNAIQSLGTGQFTIGSDASVNSNGETYYWVAFEKAGTRASEIYTGQYDCASNLSDELFIPCPFTPDLVMVACHGAATPVWATSDMTMPLSVFFDSTANSTTCITEMASAGFHLGTDNDVQYINLRYSFLAMKASTS